MVATIIMMPRAIESRNESFMADHGSIRATARRTRRGPAAAFFTAGLLCVVDAAGDPEGTPGVLVRGAAVGVAAVTVPTLLGPVAGGAVLVAPVEGFVDVLAAFAGVFTALCAPVDVDAPEGLVAPAGFEDPDTLVAPAAEVGEALPGAFLGGTEGGFWLAGGAGGAGGREDELPCVGLLPAVVGLPVASPLMRPPRIRCSGPG
jgi:hypothetical protein